MQPDFDDLRFTDSSDNILNYWVEAYIPGTSAAVWVTIPLIPGSGTTTIYMYYGNADASGDGDGVGTFIFFDDFEDGNLDEYHQSGGVWEVVDYEGSKRALLKSGTARMQLLIKNVNIKNTILDVDLKVSSLTNADKNIGLSARAQGISPMIYDHYSIFWGTHPSFDRWILAMFETFGIPTDKIFYCTYSAYSPETIWRHLTFSLYEDQLKVWVDNNLICDWYTTEINSPGMVGLRGYGSGGLYWDNFRVRKYTEPEPTVSISVALPDITLSPESWGFGSVTEGSQPQQTFTITNNGDADLVIDDITSPCSYISISDISFPATITPGGSLETFTTSVDTTGLSGDISETLTIHSNDPDEGTVDISVSGNVGGLPDLTFSSISFSDNEPRWDDKVTVTAEIENIGSGQVNSDFRVEFYEIEPYTDIEKGEHIGDPKTITKDSMKDNKETITFSWTPKFAGKYKIEGIVDAENSVIESDENNNQTKAELTVNSNKNQALLGNTAIVVFYIDYENQDTIVDEDFINDRWNFIKDGVKIIKDNADDYNIQNVEFEVYTINKANKLSVSPENAKIFSHAKYLGLGATANTVAVELGYVDYLHMLNCIKEGKNSDNVILAFFTDHSIGGNVQSKAVFFGNIVFYPITTGKEVNAHEILHCFGAEDKALIFNFNDIMNFGICGRDIVHPTDTEIGWDRDILKGLIGGKLVDKSDIEIGWDLWPPCPIHKVSVYDYPPPFEFGKPPIVTSAERFTLKGYYKHYQFALPEGDYWLLVSISPISGYKQAEIPKVTVETPKSVKERYVKIKNIKMEKCDFPCIQFGATCPVDLVLIDPSGNVISKYSIDVPESCYDEFDLNGDGSTDDLVTIHKCEIGDYQITVSPESDALPTDVFTLKVLSGDVTITMAENVPISDIPDQPYIIESTETGIIDRTPPTVTDHFPTGVDIPVTTTINVTFSEAMNQSSVQDAFTISPTSTGSFSWTGNTMIFTPTTLTQATTYEMTIGTGAEDLAGNHLQSPYTWSFTTASPVDTEPPTIVSVTLGTYTTIPDATIHVTVNATDNAGVTSVTADGVSLAETGSIWEGDITAPSTTGDYTLTIRAEDAAGNFAETTVDYSAVNPSGSIGIGVDPRLTTASVGDTALINIKLVSTENFDDIAHIYLTTEGTYPGYQADLAWFNWTSIEVEVPAGAEVNVPLEVNIPGGESGYKMFYAKLESTKWTPTAMDTGILYII